MKKQIRDLQDKVLEALESGDGVEARRLLENEIHSPRQMKKEKSEKFLWSISASKKYRNIKPMNFFMPMKEPKHKDCTPESPCIDCLIIGTAYSVGMLLELNKPRQRRKVAK